MQRIKKVDLSADLEVAKQLSEATIHIEYKADSQAPNFYNLFSVSSASHNNEYFTIAVNNGVPIVEGRDSMVISSTIPLTKRHCL